MIAAATSTTVNVDADDWFVVFTHCAARCDNPLAGSNAHDQDDLGPYEDVGKERCAHSATLEFWLPLSQECPPPFRRVISCHAESEQVVLVCDSDVERRSQGHSSCMLDELQGDRGIRCYHVSELMRPLEELLFRNKLLYQAIPQSTLPRQSDRQSEASA